jgi:hypothetical protein
VPASLRFLRVARQWLLLCVHHPLGQSLPVLFEFATSLIAQLRRSVAGQSRYFSGKSFRNSDMFSKAMFDTTMVREYVSLLGLLSSTAAGRALLRSAASSPMSSLASLVVSSHASSASMSSLSPRPADAPPAVPVGVSGFDDTDVVSCLKSLCANSPQDYLTRFVVVNLAVAECEESRGMLQQLVMSPTATLHLRLYTVNALRGMLRRGYAGFATWGVGILATAVTASTAELEVRAAALSVLTEACRHVVYATATANYLRTILRTSNGEWRVVTSR